MDGSMYTGFDAIRDARIRKERYSKINWGPLATNVLDANEYDLCTPDGTLVDFHRDGGDFVLIIHGRRFSTADNIQMSYIMNQYEIGGHLKPKD